MTPSVTDAKYVLTQYHSAHSQATTSSELFVLLENRDENRTTDASVRSIETLLTIELICPLKPKSEGPLGSNNS